jgi:hypothetical protein
MRTLIVRFTTLLAVPLSAAGFVAAGPAIGAAASTTSDSTTSAASSATSSAAAAATSSIAAAAPAPVRIQVNYPLRVRAGRTVSMKVKLTNALKTKTQEIFLAVKFPKGVSKVRVYVPEHSNYHARCTREKTRALCVLPGLSKGHSYSFWAKAWVNGSARGTLYGYFGGAVVNTPLDTDPKELLSEFGSDIRWVKSKSSIYR